MVPSVKKAVEESSVVPSGIMASAPFGLYYVLDSPGLRVSLTRVSNREGLYRSRRQHNYQMKQKREYSCV